MAAVIFHPNGEDAPFRVLVRCLELGVRPGVAWRRGDGLADLMPLLPHVDFVLCLIGTAGLDDRPVSADEKRVVRLLGDLSARYGFALIVEGALDKNNIGEFAADFHVPSREAVLADAPLLATIRMNGKEIDDVTQRSRLLHQLWVAVDAIPWIRSASLVGGFARTDDLSAASDIDFVVIVDSLTQERYAELQEKAAQAVREPLRAAGYSLRINASKGPLKFNDANTAVLHLMCYSLEEHRRHVRESPFTCLDWQRSPLWRKASLYEVYPALRLKPRDFFGGRRGVADYTSRGL